ncbi:hypothetical protein DFJ63DRAFT_333208 [Scheffersomyces coipomensis]|uniref:uncharacterized protein n=1 Tax=Scheffersomyces coipomensis TaxID=1788519 RepID=UPI00315D4277
MRDSNYKSISANKAAVTITSSLYDRRALDVTSDKPLVNSLNYLTYLVSSSAKVRETLSIDGGIERLIEILHECHNSTFNASDNIFNSEKKLLTAWKWTLAFQCLVLVGTRGTEKIRQKVVKAGILPIIATVLDNYLSIHERTFIHANSRTQQQQPHQQQQSQQQSQQLQPQQIQQQPQMAPHQQFLQHQGVEPINLLGQQQIPVPGQAPLQNDVQIPFDISTAGNWNRAQGDPEVANTETRYPFDLNVMQVPLQLAANSLDQSMLRQNPYLAYFNGSLPNSLTSDDYENLTIDQLVRLTRSNNFAPYKIGSSTNQTKSTTVNNDIRRKYVIANLLKKLREEKENELVDDSFLNDSDYEMDNNLRFLSDLYIQDIEANKTMYSSKIAVRNFTDTGVVIPRDDDIVWSLQLLAYISKYPYLKDVLQNTHYIVDMSIRDKQLKLYLQKQMKLKLKKSLEVNLRPTITPKSRKTKTTYIERFNPSPSNSPQMLNDINTIHDDNFLLEEDKFELGNKAEESGLTETAEIEDEEDESEEFEEDDDSSDKSDSDIILDKESNLINEVISNNSNTLAKLYESVIDCEAIADEVEREIALCQINDKINSFIELESKKLVNSIISKRNEAKEFLTKKWSYDDYEHFDVDEDHEDLDPSLTEFRKANLFPIVEKFTFLAGTDMYYWSGVIMRNSCRRNELRGGVRQCGNLECGKWEQSPREFSKCRRCKRTKYCSRECQMKAWHCHRNWCIPSTSSTGTSTTAATGQVHTHQSAGSALIEPGRDGIVVGAGVGVGVNDAEGVEEDHESQHDHDHEHDHEST